MNGRVAYLDSSAYLKLFVVEPESAALRGALEHWSERCSSGLLWSEVVRALRRSGDERVIGSVRRSLARVRLISVDALMLDRAGDVEPALLRTLDAIHLASAMTLGPGHATIFTYDGRLRAAAEGNGFRVLAPA